MTISLFTKEELESKKLTEITDHYNQVAKLIGLKAVKKFRDKPISVSRTLDAQETYRDDLAEAAKSVAKEKSPKKESSKVRSNKLGVAEDSMIEVIKGEPKEGSIEDSIFKAIENDGQTASVKSIVDYILTNHKRPRSDQKVDEAYALHNIKWFVKKGHLKVDG